MTHQHNYFFYFRKEMPWKNALQDKRTQRSGKKRKEMDGAKEASDESKSNSAHESAG